MVSRYVTSSDGAQIYTEAYGDPSKPALILVAGYSLHSIVFEKQLELQKDLFLVLYDSRGHGRSSMPETPEEHESKLYADDFAAVCKEYKLKKPVFGGWSLGGTIVSDICHHLGADVLGGVILIAAVPFLDLFPKVASPQLLENVPRVLEKSDVKTSREGSRIFRQALFYDVEKLILLAELRPHFKDIKVVAIDNAGHSVFYERPEETNKALLEFVKECHA